VTSLVAVAVEQGVATIWLNRPAKRNAVTNEMWVALGRHCRELADEPSARVLVVRGVGDHFCAGADIGGLRLDDPSFGRANAESEAALAQFPKPTVAFIRGSCVGGGVQIAASCDLRIADTTARLGITPARLGIIYPTSALRRVVELIGPSAAKHLLYSAELIDAQRALRIGLLDEVHPPGDAEARLDQFAALLANERSQLTQQASKAMIDAVVADGHIGPDLVAHWSAEMRSTDDLAEGMAAFAERRPARFTWTALDTNTQENP
jgi:enoyl-CoA hydratase/carnithine racemase